MTTSLHFIGFNDSAEFGLGHDNVSDEFIKCPNKSITRVFRGRGFNIFTDDNLANIWTAGDCILINEKGSDSMDCESIQFFKKII